MGHLAPPPSVLALIPATAFHEFAYTVGKLTSAVANLSLPQEHATYHIVLVYTIPKKMHAILAPKINFGPLWWVYIFDKKVHIFDKIF